MNTLTLLISAKNLKFIRNKSKTFKTSNLRYKIKILYQQY